MAVQLRYNTAFITLLDFSLKLFNSSERLFEMAATLKQLHKIHNNYRLPVWGYIRAIQKNYNLNIPMMLNYLCLGYYFHGEYFEKCGDNFKISTGLMTLTKSGLNEDWNDTAYGKIWIKSSIKQIATWKFYIEQPESWEIMHHYHHDAQFIDTFTFQNIWIYFVSNDGRTNDNCSYLSDKPYYGFNNTGETEWHNGYQQRNNEGIKFGHDSIVTVSLDTSKRMIFITKQNEEVIIVYKDIDIDDMVQYKIALQIWAQKTSVTLLNFTLELQ